MTPTAPHQELVRALTSAAGEAHDVTRLRLSLAQRRGLAVLEAALWGAADVAAHSPPSTIHGGDPVAWVESLAACCPDVLPLPQCGALRVALLAVVDALT